MGKEYSTHGIKEEYMYDSGGKTRRKEIIRKT
jgi:hypothetical protein